MSAPLSRSELARHTLLVLARGGAVGPDVLLVEAPAAPGRRAIVKDFAGRSPWVRSLLAPWLLRREAAIYRALADHPAVPAFLGFVDGEAFAVEHRPGRRLSGRRPWTFSPAFLTRLEEAVQGLHERGVAHLDLAHRSNVRADLDGRPVLIDFGASVRCRPGGLAARWLLPLLARADLRALHKWRRTLRCGA